MANKGTPTGLEGIPQIAVSRREAIKKGDIYWDYEETGAEFAGSMSRRGMENAEIYDILTRYISNRMTFRVSPNPNRKEWRYASDVGTGYFQDNNQKSLIKYVRIVWIPPSGSELDPVVKVCDWMIIRRVPLVPKLALRLWASFREEFNVDQFSPRQHDMANFIITGAVSIFVVGQLSLVPSLVWLGGVWIGLFLALNFRRLRYWWNDRLGGVKRLSELPVRHMIDPLHPDGRMDA